MTPGEHLPPVASKIPRAQPAAVNRHYPTPETGKVILTGSQRKTAFSIRTNCEKLIAGDNGGNPLRKAVHEGRTQLVADTPEFLNVTGFFTLTVGDYVCREHGKQIPGADDFGGCPLCGNKLKFVQIHDAAEANRRFNNLNRRVLPKIIERGIAVSERHKSKAIHFHLVARLAGRPDIRTGYDFKAFSAANQARAKKRINHAAETRYKLAACPALRRLWAELREILPQYGFGRAQVTPIEKTGEAVACYISKYIEKNIAERCPEDRRKKLVRYIGWKDAETKRGNQVKPNEFAWASVRATAWRAKSRALASLVHITDISDCKVWLGPRWAFKLTRLWQHTMGDDLFPGFKWDFAEREVLRLEMAKLTGRREAIRLEKSSKRQPSLLEPDEWAEFYEKHSERVFSYRSQFRQELRKTPENGVFETVSAGYSPNLDTDCAGFGDN